MKKRNLMNEIKCMEKLFIECRELIRPLKGQINFTQGHILAFLLFNENKNICQKDLEIETNLKKASITGTLDSLEDKGLIERVISKTDKRKNYIVPTQKAKDARDQVEAQTVAVNEIAFNGIDEEEISQFYKTIDKIKTNLIGGKQ